MRWITILLTVLTNTLCSAKVVNISYSPICIIKNSVLEKPCASFKERPVEMLEEESWAEQPINKTDNGNHYINISVTFASRYEFNTLLVMIQYENFPLPEKTWEIQPITREMIEFPILITVAYAPMTANVTRYQIRRIVNPNNLFDDPACNKTATILECNNLRSSKLFMRKTWESSLSIAMSSEMAASPLLVEVLSAQCNFTCRGDLNPCSVVEIKHLQWANPTEELKIYNHKNSTEPVYYCARISMAFHECCMIYTETVILTQDDHQRVAVTFSQKTYFSECFLVISILLALLISALLTVRKIFGDNSYKCWPYYSIRPQPSVEDSGNLINSVQEELITQSKPNTTPGHIIQQPVEILLIYPKESETLEKLMMQFKHILSFYVKKVWDPLDDLEIENVCESPCVWLENFLSKNNVKVILVEDTISSEWHQNYLPEHSLPQYHHLDSLFLYTVSVLHSNPYLCHDYQRLFIIRFSSVKGNGKSMNIVPGTRYEIPRNFAKLITDIVGPSGSLTQDEFQPLQKEMEELESIVTEYRQEKENLTEKKL